ncbi:TrbC/VIRB2 family protein [Bacillus phage Novomoskovsk]|uniref:TrbC/VIRB2 family protein n=1 Tax=Bacillus phage Novomoskovsk TaxID=2736258 RepID=A0A6M9Z643_9CAUD|nr:TrbC/VIRB2 family protein [Bacillus phage Novomoskovsk]
MKTEVIPFREFMAGNNRQVKPKKDRGMIKKTLTAAIPFAVVTKGAFAQEMQQAGVGEYVGSKSMEMIAHAFDPLIQLLVALSLPVCSVVLVGACFMFMFNSERAWGAIMKTGLSYVLIQMSPIFLTILKNVGTAVAG